MKDTDITEETREAVLRAVSAFEEDDGTLDDIIRAAREDQPQESIRDQLIGSVANGLAAAILEASKRAGDGDE